MNITRSYTLELEELIKHELLPVYLRYYRLMNVESPLTAAQKQLLGELYIEPKLCSLVKPTSHK